jgi:hypothetical protein
MEVIMAINRYELVTRHNPNLTNIDVKSPLTVGNGEFAYTVDVTGMQTLYDLYLDNASPLCTMSQWGWHTTPVSGEQYRYTTQDLQMTEYEYGGRKVAYAVEKKRGNEEVYDWLRRNPHRINLGRIGFLYQGIEVQARDIDGVHQTLDLYRGMIESDFILGKTNCKVITCCHPEEDTLAFTIESELLHNGSLSIQLAFPYGSPDITGSDWSHPDRHRTEALCILKKQLLFKRTVDLEEYYVGMLFDEEVTINQDRMHDIRISFQGPGKVSFTVKFSKDSKMDIPSAEKTCTDTISGWKEFWESGGVIDLQKATDPRAPELERRIVLSQYLTAVNCCGSLPPQETGLTCNSWHGKFHLEMHPWHTAYLPLWNRANLLDKSLIWYKLHLEEAKANAARNGFAGAKWPKQVAYDAIDSPSPIATLLIWQQPHIIYLLELDYQNNQCEQLLKNYFEVVKETADYMADLVVCNPSVGRYELIPPIIPAQEEHNPTHTLNPVFELEYWYFALNIASHWARRLGLEELSDKWQQIASNLADPPVKEGCYFAHENCPDTFTRYNKDHPSMLAAFGFIPGDRMDRSTVRKTLGKVLNTWNFDTTWGWDFAMLAMTAVRLEEPELAIDILLMDTPNNHYGINGHNVQKLRSDLPVYLPGNGSLLFAAAMMTAGYQDCKEINPGFPKNGQWQIEYENIDPFPY